MPHDAAFNTKLADGIRAGYLTADEAATVRNLSGQWGAGIVAATDKSYPVRNNVAVVTAQNGVVTNVRFDG